MKKVLLLTKDYPFGTGESFIEAEMINIPQNVSVVLLPMRSSSEKTQRSIPNNVTLDQGLRVNNQFRYLFAVASVLINGDYWNELCTISRRKRLTIHDCSASLDYFARGRMVKNYIEKNYKQFLKHKEIIIYSYWLLYGSYAAKLLKEKYGCKCVSRAHGVDLWDSASPYGVTPGKKKVVDTLDGIYVCNLKGTNYLSEQYPAGRICCGYLGTNDYGYQTGDNRLEVFQLVSCSRMVPLKRIDLIAKALSIIEDINIRWTHYGDGETYDDIKELILKLPRNIEVVLMGNIAHDQLMNSYKKQTPNLFVNVSNTEGLPVSIMEAISFGIPVVATDVGGTSEIVNEKNGVLLPDNFEVESLSNTISMFCKMKSDEYISYRNNARKWWEDRFSASKNYADFYSEITK